jgi:small subunit ribosomal protein S20
MPIIKSAVKRMRQTATRRSRNLQVKRAIHSGERALTDAVTAGEAQQVTTALRQAISEIDRAVKKGTLHRNTASRRKSQLTKLANTVAAPKKSAASKPKAKPTAAKAPAKKATKKTTGKTTTTAAKAPKK